jgi:lysophospholipase L1-like esterase
MSMMQGSAPGRARRARFTRRRVLVYAAALGSMAVAGVVALLALDVYLHWRTQYSAGFNVWGYRGDTVGRKKPNETRIIVLGGSTAFGYGLPSNESWPYFLEQQLAARRALPSSGTVRVVNLGVPTDSAGTFVSTLDDYAYLHADIAMFYEGYNDLGLDVNRPQIHLIPEVSHYMAWRHLSPIFRWTGYLPIFPLVLSEKASQILHGREPSLTSTEVVFQPNLARRTTAAAMESAAEIGATLERRLGRLTDTQGRTSQFDEHGCGRWSRYCGAIEEAIRAALARHQRVIVITQPYFSDLHVEQQSALAAMLAARFAGDERVEYVNLGRLLDLRDPAIAYDGVHLVAAANARVAEALVPAVLQIVNVRIPRS